MDWNKKKLLWGVEFIIALLGTMIEWTERNCADQSIGGRLRQLQDNARDTKDQLGFLGN